MNRYPPTRSTEETKLVSVIRRLSHPLRPKPAGLKPRHPRLPEVKAVLYDIYGTLLVSAAGDIDAPVRTDHRTALYESLAALRRPGDRGAMADAIAPLYLQRIRQVRQARHSEGCAYPEVDVRAIWRQCLDHLRQRDGLMAGGWRDEQTARLAVEFECRINPVWPMPGAGKTLRDLQRRGLRLGVVSNAQFYTPLALEALLNRRPGTGRAGQGPGGTGRTACALSGLGFEPRLCVWSFELGVAKPSPQLVEAALRVLRGDFGIRPAQVLCIGNDMLNDVAPAAAAGCRTALFAGDGRSLRLREDEPRCAGLRPDAVITHLDQLGLMLTGGIPG